MNFKTFLREGALDNSLIKSIERQIDMTTFSAYHGVFTYSQAAFHGERGADSVVTKLDQLQDKAEAAKRLKDPLLKFTLGWLKYLATDDRGVHSRELHAEMWKNLNRWIATLKEKGFDYPELDHIAASAANSPKE